MCHLCKVLGGPEWDEARSKSLRLEECESYAIPYRAPTFESVKWRWRVFNLDTRCTAFSSLFSHCDCDTCWKWNALTKSLQMTSYRPIWFFFQYIKSHAETAWKEFSVAHFTLSSLKSCICASPREGKTPVTLWHVFLACFYAVPRKHHTLIWEMLQPWLLFIFTRSLSWAAQIHSLQIETN